MLWCTRDNFKNEKFSNTQGSWNPHHSEQNYFEHVQNAEGEKEVIQKIVVLELLQKKCEDGFNSSGLHLPCVFVFHWSPRDGVWRAQNFQSGLLPLHPRKCNQLGNPSISWLVKFKILSTTFISIFLIVVATGTVITLEGRHVLATVV